jgi:hypothetical protein
MAKNKYDEAACRLNGKGEMFFFLLPKKGEKIISSYTWSHEKRHCV